MIQNGLARAGTLLFEHLDSTRGPDGRVDMNTSRAFVAGVVGGVVMSIFLAMARFMGMPANLEMIEGTMLMDPGPVAWILGFVMHLVLSGLIALVYAWGFEHVTHRAGWLVGAGFGILHAIIAGMVMGMMPMIHPRMPSPVMPPGAFMSHLGLMGPIAVFMLHMIYGAVVGRMYAPVTESARVHALT